MPNDVVFIPTLPVRVSDDSINPLDITVNSHMTTIMLYLGYIFIYVCPLELNEQNKAC